MSRIRAADGGPRRAREDEPAAGYGAALGMSRYSNARFAVSIRQEDARPEDCADRARVRLRMQTADARVAHRPFMRHRPQCVTTPVAGLSSFGGVAGAASSARFSTASGMRSSASSSTWSIHLTGMISSRFLMLSGISDEILHVLLRNQHRLDAAAMRRQQLFLQPADRQHLAAQRDLAGHRDIGAHRDAGQRPTPSRCRCRCRRSDRPWASRLRAGGCACRSSGRNPRRCPSLRGAAAHHGQRGLDRLLHHLAQLAGGDGLALARHRRRFDGQQFAADLGPGQAGDLPDLVVLLGDAEVYRRTPRNLSRLRAVTAILLLAALGHQASSPPCGRSWRSRAPGCARRLRACSSARCRASRSRRR